MEHKSHARAGKITQKRIISQTGKHLLHNAGFLQCVHRARHIQQAGKEDTESDRDVPVIISRMPMIRAIGASVDG